MDAETGSPDDKTLEFRPGYYPIQCDDCGRGLVNMGCRICSPFVTPIRRNRGGFSQVGQLTVALQSGPASPRKRASSKSSSQPILKIEFIGLDGELPGLILGSVGFADPPIQKGTEKRFLRRTTPGSEFIVPTLFRWQKHKKNMISPA